MDNFIFCAVQVTVNTFFKHTASLEHASYAAKLSKAAAFINDVTIKIIKANTDNFAAFSYHAYNENVISGTFPLVFKLGDVKQIHKINWRLKRHIAYFQTILR